MNVGLIGRIFSPQNLLIMIVIQCLSNGLTACSGSQQQVYDAIYSQSARIGVFSDCAYAVENGFAAVEDNMVRVYWKDSSNAQANILYFHGNGSNACTSLPISNVLEGDVIVNWISVEYPNYQTSADTVYHMQEIVDQALGAYDYVTSNSSLPIIPFGHSLGTGVATYVASKRAVAGLLLVSPYTSVHDVVRVHYGNFALLLLPLLIHDQYPAFLWASTVSTAIEILYSEADQVIPPSLSIQQASYFLSSPHLTVVNEPPDGETTITHSNVIKSPQASIAISAFVRSLTRQ